MTEGEEAELQLFIRRANSALFKMKSDLSRCMFKGNILWQRKNVTSSGIGFVGIFFPSDRIKIMDTKNATL